MLLKSNTVLNFLNASMRPWHFSHGNHLGGATPAALVHRFNEAVAFQPRKFHTPGYQDFLADASMRPWHFSHGNWMRYAWYMSDFPGFNEAVAFQPRK